MRRYAWVVGVVALLACAPGARAATPEYFPFPTDNRIAGFGVTADAAGDIWFTASNPARAGQPTPSLARLVPSQAAAGTSNGIAFFPMPDPQGVNCCGNQARSAAFNPVDGRLYYVRSDGNVGFVVPSAAVPGTSTGFTSTMLPGYQDLWDIAPSPVGGAWFTEHSASNVAPTFYGDRIAYYNGSVTEGPNVAIQDGNTTLNSLRYSAMPAGIAVAPSGRPWFVEENPGNPGYRVATYAGNGDHYDEFQITPCEGVSPCSGSFTGTGLTDVAIAPDGGIWFTNVLNKKFGRFDPESHTMVQYAMGSIDPSLVASLPRQITAAPDGTIWMTAVQSGYNAPGNALVRIVPSETPSTTFTPLANDRPPLGIGADNAGSIWFGLANATAPSLVGRLAGVVGLPPTPESPAPALPATPQPPVVLKPASIGTAKVGPPQTGNGAINTNQICVGPPEARCSLIYLIREREYVTGFPSAAGKKRKHQPRVLGTKTVTLHGGQKAKVTVKLNKLGQRILKGKHKLKVVFSASQKLANGKTKTVTKKTLTLRSPKSR